jgi:hypothetical protein
MPSVPMLSAFISVYEETFTVAAFMFFDFVVLSVFVLFQSTGFFTFKIAFDSIVVYSVTYIVVDFQMFEILMILQLTLFTICFVAVCILTRMLMNYFLLGLIRS